METAVTPPEARATVDDSAPVALESVGHKESTTLEVRKRKSSPRPSIMEKNLMINQQNCVNVDLTADEDDVKNVVLVVLKRELASNQSITNIPVDDLKGDEEVLQK